MEKWMDPAITERINRLIDNVEKVVFGKRDVVRLCVTGLLARGHVLIEDVPGIGKTTLAQALARSINCSFTRLQFTSDMLPSDILGISILNPRTQDFEFRKGPIFANIVLADEINRTPPKTQSALLEAMSEFHVSVDGRTYPVPLPFMVLATQNPVEYEGTYTLPESQLDRFMLRVEMGYPPEDDEVRIMRRSNPSKILAELEPALTIEEVLNLQEEASRIAVDESVARYMLAIVQATREDDHIQLGASPRSSLSMYEACQAFALVDGRDYVTPGDVKKMAIPLLSHRVLVRSRGGDLVAVANERVRVIAEIVKRVPVPA
jgi:MoxR-like ATPase